MPSTWILVILLATFIIYLRNKQSVLVKGLLLAAILMYFLFSITITANIITSPLVEKFNSENANYSPSVRTIVLLTGSVLDRGSQALMLYHELNQLEANEQPPIKIIISGTSALNPADYSEAIKTKSFLVRRGVTDEAIVLETESKNTAESATNIAKLIGFQPVYLITSDYHMARAILAFQQAGLTPIAVPADSSQTNDYSFSDFLPNPENLKKIDLATHEYLGILYLKLKN